MPVLPPNYNNEDLESNSNNELQFADRTYDPINFSGYGRKILRPNIQNVTRFDTVLSLSGSCNSSGNVNINIDGISYDLPVFAAVPSSVTMNILGGFDRYKGIGSGAYTGGSVVETLTLNTPLPMNMGVFQKDSLTITSAPASAGNITITLDGANYTIAVTTADTIVTIAYKILQGLPYAANWDYSYTPGSSAVILTARTVGAQTTVSINAGSTGVTATVSNITAGAVQMDLWGALATITLQNYTADANEAAGTVTLTANTAGTNTTLPRFTIPGSGYYWEPASWTLGAVATQAADLAAMMVEMPFVGVLISVAGGNVTISKIGSAATVSFTDNGLGITAIQTTTSSQQSLNILDTAALTDANTVYEIRYDFYANGNITLPTNVTFDFSSGSFNAINFSGNNAYLMHHVSLYNCKFSNLINKESYTSWFSGTTAFMLQSAINLFENQQTKGQVYVDAQNGNLTAPIQIDLDFSRINFLGNQIICSNTNHIRFFTLTTHANTTTVSRLTSAFENVVIVGSYIGTAIHIETNYTGDNGGSPAASVDFNRVGIINFMYGVTTGANAYGINFNVTDIRNSIIGFQRLPTSNSGERIQINRGFIAQNVIGILSAGGGCSMFADNVSFDHNECQGIAMQGGTLMISNSHIETNSHASFSHSWKCSDGKSYIQITGSVLLFYIYSGRPLGEPFGYAKVGNKMFSVKNCYMWGGASDNSTMIEGAGYVDLTGTSQLNTLDGNTDIARLAPQLNLLKSFPDLQNAANLGNGGTFTQIGNTDLIKVTVGSNTEFRCTLNVVGNYNITLFGIESVVSSLIPLTATTNGVFRFNLYYTNREGQRVNNGSSIILAAGNNGIIKTTTLYDQGSGLKPINTNYDILQVSIESSGLSSFIMSLPFLSVGDSSARLMTVSENTLQSVTPSNIVLATKAIWAQTLNSILTAWSAADYRYYNGLVSLEATCTLAATAATTISLPYTPEHSGTRLCGDTTVTLTAGSNTASIQAATPGNKTLNFIYHV